MIYIRQSMQEKWIYSIRNTKRKAENERDSNKDYVSATLIMRIEENHTQTLYQFSCKYNNETRNIVA